MLKRKLMADKGSQVNDVNKRIADKLKTSKIEVKVDYLKDPWKKVYDSMTSFSNNAYQWFQVAEIGYDNFMARHSQG